MDAQSTDTVDRQRPFKIFISLLDKWEIGAALTEVLVLDAFAALRTSLRPNDDHDEVSFRSRSVLGGRGSPIFCTLQLLMTGNMLFEILDPFLMWKQIYFSLRDAVDGAGSVEVGRFLLRAERCS